MSVRLHARGVVRCQMTLLLLAALCGAGPESGQQPPDQAVPVRWISPAGATVYLLTPDGWTKQQVPFVVGLYPGHRYLLRMEFTVADEPIVLCPTVEVLRPIHVPKDLDPWDYPVVVGLSDFDLATLQQGGMIIKVATLERPDRAIPVSYPVDEVPELDAPVGADPLELAQDLGMPVLILRVGTRVYSLDEGLAWPRSPVQLHPPTAQREEEEPEQSAVQQASFDVVGRFSTPSFFAIPHPFVPVPAGGLDPSYLISKIDYSYICDGGDRVPRAGRDPVGVTFGLEPSETVGFYSSQRGQVAVPAAPVCVYAPRYVSVRSVIRGAVQRVSVGTDVVRQLEGRHQLQLRRSPRVSRAHRDVAIEIAERKAVQARQQTAIAQASRVDVLHANVRTLRIARIVLDMMQGELSQAEEAWLASRVAAAEVWKVEQRPAYTALSQAGGVLQGYARPEAVLKVEEPPRRPGQIVLWKVANKASAKPGDIIEFAIYYRNVGDQPVYALSIMDNLVPRLEYIEQSSGSSRPSVFTYGPNEAGSAVLRWDIPGEIKPGEQGAVWFKARVR